MSDITKQDLIAALDEVLNSRRTVDDDLHHKHHEFIEMELERREAKKLLFAKFKSSFVGGLALAVLGFLAWLGQLILNWVQSGPTH